MNFRMTELSGAVLLAQVRKLDLIRDHLRANKAIVKSAIADLPGLGFRTIVDPEGDLATHWSSRSRRRDREARRRRPRLDHARSLGLARLLEHGAPPRAADRRRQGLPVRLRCYGSEGVHYAAGMLPVTDALLARSMSIGIGVFDTNLAPWGLRMRDDEEAAQRVAERFCEVGRPLPRAGRPMAGGVGDRRRHRRVRAGRTLFHAPFIATVDGLRLAAVATSRPGPAGGSAGASTRAAIVVEASMSCSSAPTSRSWSSRRRIRSHAPIATRALEAGRHVVVDKPIAMDVPRPTRSSTRGRAGRVLTVFQNRRWDGDFLTVRSLVERGRLGAIDSLEARFERWAPSATSGGRSAEQAGGPHRDLGAHLVDQSLLLFGGRRAVFAQIDRRRQGTAVDDSVFVAIDHTERRPFAGVDVADRRHRRAPLAGPRPAGEYVKDNLDVQERQLPGRDAPERRASARKRRSSGAHCRRRGPTPIPTERGDYGRFYAMLRDAIRDGGPLPVDPLDAIRGLRVLEAAERSARIGRGRRPCGGGAMTAAVAHRVLPGLGPVRGLGRADGDGPRDRCARASMSSGPTTTPAARGRVGRRGRGSWRGRSSRPGRRCSGGPASRAARGWAASSRVPRIETPACS